MPNTRPPYPPEFRAEAVRLVREGGRNPDRLARELGCSGQAVRNWVRQADLDAGRRSNGLTTGEQEELRRMALDALGVRAQVYRADHKPRYLITAGIPLVGQAQRA